MKFLQLSGAGRAGKTTVANILFDIAHDNNYIPVIIPFAKALKDEAVELGYSKEESPKEYREFCQKWGAKRRKEDPDYWVKKITVEIDRLGEIELHLKNSKEDRFEHLVIQDDVRYMNELAFGREHNAYQLFVTTGNREISDLLDSWRLHESEDLALEVEIGNTDYTDIFNEYVVNAGTNLDLFKLVHERFFSWITETEPLNNSLNQAYREGKRPSEQFMIMLAHHEEQKLLNELNEALGLTDDDERTKDSDT